MFLEKEKKRSWRQRKTEWIEDQIANAVMLATLSLVGIVVLLSWRLWFLVLAIFILAFLVFV